MGGIAPDYVLDRMESYEMKAIMEHLYLRTRDDWERTRFAAYVTAQTQSRKSLKPEDLLKFPWEKPKEEKKKPAKAPDRKATARLREKARYMIENGLLDG